MNKEIEKYIWYYLGVYIVVLLTFAAFQYFGECDGESLNCKTNWEKVKDILQTTAYMLTPIVAIIGFYAWKEEKEYEKEYDKVDDILKTISSMESQLKTYTGYLKFLNTTLKEESNLIIYDENTIDLSFHKTFNEDFNYKIKILNSFSSNRDLVKLSSEYHDKICQNISIPLQKILSTYFIAVRNIKANQPKFSVVGIKLDNELYNYLFKQTNLNCEDLLKLMQKNQSELQHLDLDFFNDFLYALNNEQKKLEVEYLKLIKNESKKLKNELYKIKKIPCSN